MRYTRFTFLTLAFIVYSVISTYGQTSIGSAETAGFSSARLERYTHFLSTEIDEGRIPGAVTMVIRKGQLVHQETLGYSSLADKKPMQQDQLFYIQSMTKPIVTVAFMMLYEEGHFFLTDPVSKYIPAFKDLKVAKDVEAGAEGETDTVITDITIAHILSHTAGFSHGLGGSKLDQETARALYYKPHDNIESRVNALLSMPLIGQPGEQWYYSASPDVLALLIEIFSGMPTDEFLQKRLFDPLGMKDTGYNVSKEKQDRAVSLHNISDEGKLVNSEYQTKLDGYTVSGGTHGLFSTAADYMTFCQMLLNEGEWNGTRYLSRKTIELMTRNHVGNLISGGQGFGLGFGVLTDLVKNEAIGSAGQYYWSGAYCTYFFIDPKEELISLMMTQVAPYSNYYGDKMRQFVYQAIDD